MEINICGESHPAAIPPSDTRDAASAPAAPASTLLSPARSPAQNMKTLDSASAQRATRSSNDGSSWDWGWGGSRWAAGSPASTLSSGRFELGKWLAGGRRRASDQPASDTQLATRSSWGSWDWNWTGSHSWERASPASTLSGSRFELGRWLVGGLFSTPPTPASPARHLESSSPPSSQRESVLTTPVIHMDSAPTTPATLGQMVAPSALNSKKRSAPHSPLTPP